MRDDLRVELDKSSGIKIGYKSSIKSVEKYIASNEKILYVETGNVTYEPSGRLKADNFVAKGKEPCLIVITDSKLLLYYKMMSEERFEQYPASEIREYRYQRNSLVGSKLRIITLTKTFDLDLNYREETIKRAVDALDKITRKTTPQGQESNVSDPLDQLEKISKLHDKGVITTAEYERKKKELLDRI